MPCGGLSLRRPRSLAGSSHGHGDGPCDGPVGLHASYATGDVEQLPVRSVQQGARRNAEAGEMLIRLILIQ